MAGSGGGGFGQGSLAEVIRPQKASAASTGFTSQVAGLMADTIVEKAVADKTAQLEREAAREAAIADALQSREESKYLREAGDGRDERLGDNEDADREGRPAAEDDDLEALRARRRQQMKEAQDKRKKHAALGHGSFEEISEEEFLKTVTASERCVVHFYHRHFERCKILDMHLGKCAPRFFGTRFVKLDSEKAPFFVEKLKIRTLPCVVVFVEGVAKGRQVGFDGLGGDEFTTAQLAWRLKEWGGIEEDFGPEDEI